MKRLLAISIASVSIAIGAIPAVAEVDAKTHKLCLEAKDYLGCVKAQDDVNSTTKSFIVNVKARTKELKQNLFEFNKNQHILKAPNLAQWIKSNPEAARKFIEKEFLFFSKNDYKYPATFTKSYEGDEGRVYGACIKRGANIDSLFDWEKACSEVADYYDIDKNNEVLRDEILVVREKEEASEIENAKCMSSGRTMRRAAYQNVCMSDYEYAAFKQREEENAANERFRLQLEQDRKAERKRRLIQNAFKGVADSFKQNQPVNCFGSATSFGSTTYGNSTCY